MVRMTRVIVMRVMLMSMCVRCGLASVLMRTAHLNRHQIHLPVPHATLSDQCLRKTFHLR